MQLTNVLAISALFFSTLVAALPGPVSMREPAGDLEEFFTRGTRHCSNIAKIKRPTRYEAEGCVPEKSKGFASMHNCKNKGGRAYMCVQSGQSFCTRNMNGDYENGECFL
ncbi:hypothetical protein D9613_003442 [Agrocybe pediades]|uniref:Uncharacterized protein n=1 Tax=Agrocybe pediades TaxID=84607 RepID=A0A8H4VKX2_9AGAR|nr:hypothetical protein D9613_003442 [Agrocybe pediades]